MVECGVDKLVLFVFLYVFMYWVGEFGSEYVCICNDEMFVYCCQDLQYFDFWCYVNLVELEVVVQEIECVVMQLGVKGVCVGGINFNGIEIYDECLFLVWEKIEKLDVLIMVYGFNQFIYWGEKYIDDKFEIILIVGDCVDEILFFWYLICGGVLDVFFRFKVYIIYVGGMVVFQLGCFSELNQVMVLDVCNCKLLMDYLENFYFDFDVYVFGLCCGVVEVVGVD